ncbi:MAG: hypothetical protein IPP40_07930 [bacterium]|nr:hypothetical protein [bacterium]
MKRRKVTKTMHRTSSPDQVVLCRNGFRVNAHNGTGAALLWYPSVDVNPRTASPVLLIASILSVRATGETDINPVGAMGQDHSGGLWRASPGHDSLQNLMAAGITAAGASQSEI